MEERQRVQKQEVVRKKESSPAYLLNMRIDLSWSETAPGVLTGIIFLRFVGPNMISLVLSETTGKRWAGGLCISYFII